MEGEEKGEEGGEEKGMVEGLDFFFSFHSFSLFFLFHFKHLSLNPPSTPCFPQKGLLGWDLLSEGNCWYSFDAFTQEASGIRLDRKARG